MSRRATIAAGVLVSAVVLTAWYGRVREGQRALAECDGAIARSEWPEAIFHARAAADARCPLCSAPERGHQRLAKIAERAEERNDHATAIAAWRAARAAALASALFDTAPERRRTADREIARLGHKIDAAAAAAGANATPAASEERLRTVLEGSYVPSGATIVLLAIGAVLFFAGAGAYALGRGRRNVALGAVAIAVGLVASALLLF